MRTGEPLVNLVSKRWDSCQNAYCLLYCSYSIERMQRIPAQLA